MSHSVVLNGDKWILFDDWTNSVWIQHHIWSYFPEAAETLKTYFICNSLCSTLLLFLSTVFNPPHPPLTLLPGLMKGAEPVPETSLVFFYFLVSCFKVKLKKKKVLHTSSISI